MNTRGLKIIEILSKSVEPVSSIILSQEIGCSTKTIQNEIKYINKELKNGKIVSIRGIGYKIELDTEDIDIKISNICDYDRVEYVIKKLININKGSIKLEELAEYMYVSLSTIKNDLKEVKKILEEYNIKIISKHKQGIGIEALEENIIKFIISYSNNSDNSLNIKDFLNDNIIEDIFTIKNMVLDTLNDENLILTDNEFKNLLNYISIHLSRNDSSYLDFIQKYIKDYKNKIQNKITEHEKDLILKSIREFCINLNRATSINICNDKVFEKYLFNHICNLYKYTHLNSNPYTKDYEKIKLKYPFEFELGKIAKKTIEKNLAININDDEISKIALHIGGALQRISKNNENKIYKTIIVCSYGIGTSMLIKSKLEDIFKGKLEIVKVIPAYLVDYISVLDIDFVISTIDIKIDNVNLIKISPMLTDKDIKLISKYIETEKIYVNLNIQDLFSSDLFFKDIDVKNSFEVIDIMSKELLKQGYIDDTMRKAYFEREEIATTEIGNMVAIPHGGSGRAYENKIAIGILKEPILWEVGKVRFVIMLALNKEEILDYQEIFSDIYKRVDSIAKVISICENKNYEKFINLFK